MFAVGCLLAAFLLAKTGDWVWSYFAKPNQLLLSVGSFALAAAATVGAYRSDRVFTAAYDVTQELEKVTWPERKETSAATVIVIVTVLVSGLILWMFDLILGGLANLLIR